MKKRKIVSIIALALALIMLLGTVLPVILYADELSDLKQQLEDLKDQQGDVSGLTKEKEEKLQQMQTYVNQLTAEITACDSRIQELEDRLGELNTQIEDNEALLVQTEVELTEAQKQEESYSEALSQRIQRMYESNDTSYIELLLKSTSISDFFCRLEYISQMMEYDNRGLKSLEEISQQIRDHKELIQTTKKSLEEDKAQAQTEQQNLETVRQEKAEKLPAVQAAVADIEGDLRELATESSAIEQRIRDAEAKIEEEERRREEQNREETGGLSFIWPLNGWKELSDYFGPRIHPIYGTYSNHNGIDIPAYAGTDIHSIESGIVIVASDGGYWNGGYGNYIMVSHGNGFVSLYAHCSRVYVSVGERVSRGEVIGAVGTTGNSTGNHLHLEVRLNGTRVDPLDYVPR